MTPAGHDSPRTATELLFGPGASAAAPACGSMRTVSAGLRPVSRMTTVAGGPVWGTVRTSAVTAPCLP